MHQAFEYKDSRRTRYTCVADIKISKHLKYTNSTLLHAPLPKQFEHYLQLSSEDCSQYNTLDWQLLSVRSKVSSEPVLLTFIITKGLCNYHKICRITLHPPLVIEDLSTQIVQMHLLLQALMKVVVLLVIISVIMR
ncbi:hypothetical protein GQX74_002898 [Glossina fuscipes]|nr:hypothetical protein GQX74_002898 [Glossina fuscipes]